MIEFVCLDYTVARARYGCTFFDTIANQTPEWNT